MTGGVQMRHIAAILMIGTLGVSCSAGDGEFTLVDGGQPSAQIICRQEDRQDCSEAVGRFNFFLHKITGTKLPTEGNTQKNTIRIRILPTRKLEQVYAWKISFPKPDEMLVEAGKYGLSNALTALLEKSADCRFLGVENCMFQYEEKSSLFLPRQSFRPPEGFSFFRGAWLIPNHQRELGLTGNPYFHYSHGIPVFAFPKEKYQKTGWPEEAMPILNGKKLKRPAQPFYRWQPCYSNPETARIAAENILEKLAEKAELSITLGVNDNFGFCECARCRKMDAGSPPSIFSNDKSNHSASYYTFVNRVAEAVCKKYPALRIVVLAYFDTITPPPFPLHPNILPMLTLDTVQGAIDPEVKKNHLSIIDQWSRKVREIGVWEYCWGRKFLIPRVNFAHQAEMLKYLYQRGCRAHFAENSQIADALDGPKMYLMSCLLKDPSRKTGEILNEWFSRFAGPEAEPFLREIYRRCEAYWQSEELKKSPAFRTCRYVYAFPTGLHLFSLKPGFTKGLLELAGQVGKHARTPQEKRRADLLIRHFEQVDSETAMRGWAYTAPESGEFASAADAAAYFDMIQKEFPRILACHKRAGQYFRNADVLKKYSDYVSMKLFEPDAAKMLTDGFLHSFGFMDDPAVAAAADKIAAMPDMPESIRKLVLTMRTGKNVFAGQSPADWNVPTRNRRTEDQVELCGGKPTVRLFSVSADEPVKFIVLQKAEPGLWAVSLKVKTGSETGKADLCLWPARGGASGNWEELRQLPLPPGRWQSFSRTCRVAGKNDSVAIILRFTGFAGNEPVWIGDLRLVKIN